MRRHAVKREGLVLLTLRKTSPDLSDPEDVDTHTTHFRQSMNTETVSRTGSCTFNGEKSKFGARETQSAALDLRGASNFDCVRKKELPRGRK